METSDSVNYQVWGADRIAYGPVELPTLVDWIQQGRITAKSWVFKDDDDSWSRASDLPELKILFKSKPPAPAAGATGEPEIQPDSLRRIKLLADVEERLLASLLPYLEVVKIPAFEVLVN